MASYLASSGEGSGPGGFAMELVTAASIQCCVVESRLGAGVEVESGEGLEC